MDTVLITGAAGSIGSELARQLAKMYTVIALDQDESGLFDLEDVVPEIANVRNRERLDEIFLKYKPKMVYHAAAYKHLSNYEREHLEEVVLTNVLGTLNVIKLCSKYGARLVFISTDKAVNPTSLMGTTKLLGEVMVKRCGGTVVRFGNVVGSRGSVIPKWEKQHREGKQITITDPKMKRYFMNTKDACELVIRAGEIGQGGEVMILDMGEQRNIIDVAYEMFEEPDIHIIGAKEGEKFEEELMTEQEKKNAIKNEKIWIVK